MAERKVGIVILNFNGSEFLKYSLDSLLRAKTDVAYEVGVIDNGSAEKDAKTAQKYFEQFQKDGGKGFFVRSEKNLGFSGGNNVVIKQFLEDAEITHICLLNSDVLVTDHWLEYLTDDDYDVTGPVTNATGNEQTIAVDYDIELNGDAFDVVNKFSHYRHETYATCVCESDKLNFFNTVFHRRVIDSIGLLDERFYPGSYEDDDYCVRTKMAGFRMMIIRGCHVHHFGSGSFSKLDMPDRINISNVNRTRFEEKWNVTLESSTWRMLQSCRQDLEHFENATLDIRSSALIFKAIMAAETLIKNWETGINWYQSEQYAQSIIQQHEVMMAAQNAAEKQLAVQGTSEVKPVYSLQSGFTHTNVLSGRHLLYLLAKKIQMKLYQTLHLPSGDLMKDKVFMFNGYQYPTLPLGVMSGREMITRMVKLALIKLGLKRDNRVQITLENKEIPEEQNERLLEEYPVIAEIVRVLGKRQNKVAIHAPIFTKENERDGYIQRIKRVDEEIFDRYVRVYFLEDGKQSDRINATKIDEEHYFITYNSQDPDQRSIVFSLVEMCGLMYVHSINRFMTDSVNVEMCQLLNKENVKTIWDVHGSVPEEYFMYGSEMGKKIGDEVESFFYHHADVIVVVNHAMKRHLMKKHGESDATFVVMPIFNIDIKTRHNRIDVRKGTDDDKPLIVYAGGTQKWQNVALMQSVMDQTGDNYNYKIFVPNPDEFNESWDGGKRDNILVDSRSPEELAQEYAACDYGFVLRDADVVNYVACPTKIIEYIQYGIVPVMKTTEIGDFVELGMQYVSYERCIDGTLPDKAAAAQMAAENYKLLDELYNTYIEGVQTLKDNLGTVERIPAGEKPAVGLVVTTFERGGLEQIVLYLYHGYKKAGFKTYLLCQKDILGSMAQQIDEGELLVFHDSEEELISLLREHQITNLHYHYNIFALEKMRDLGVNTIYTVHNTYNWLSDREIKERAEFMRLADYVVPVSEAVEHYFNARTDNVCQNVHTIYNGISFDELSIRELPEHVTRKALGIGENDITLAFVASFYYSKGQAGMVGAMEKIIQKNPNVKLLLVGNVGSQEYYDRFKKHLDKSPAKDHIIQVDYFEHKYMGEFLRQTADVFILPTMQEGCSNAILEAIYCDKPMIVTDVGNAQQAKREACCVVLPTPYPDIVTLKSEELNEISALKDMPNQEAVVNAVLDVASNLAAYKEKAKLTDAQKRQFSEAQMVESYLELLYRLNGMKGE